MKIFIFFQITNFSNTCKIKFLIYHVSFIFSYPYQEIKFFLNGVIKKNRMSDSDDFDESTSEFDESPISPVLAPVRKGKKSRSEKKSAPKNISSDESNSDFEESPTSPNLARKSKKVVKQRKTPSKGKSMGKKGRSSTPPPPSSDEEVEEKEREEEKEKKEDKKVKEEGRVEKIERPVEKVIFKAEFTAGYVIRQVLEFYEKLLIHSIPFYFKERDISIVTGTINNKAGRHMISMMELFTDDILDYYLDMDLVNIEGDDESDSCYVEQFSIDLIKSILKSITKTCSILISKTTTSDTVHMVIKANAVVKTGIKSAKYQITEHNLSMFDDLPPVPNVKIDTSEFNTSIKGMSKDTNYTSFKVFPSGVYLSYHSPDGAVMKHGSFGTGVPDTIEEMDRTDPDDFLETRVSGGTIKALQKIHGMSSNSILKITSARDGYLQIRHKIGDFGEHRIYLIDNS